MAKVAFNTTFDLIGPAVITFTRQYRLSGIVVPIGGSLRDYSLCNCFGNNKSSYRYEHTFNIYILIKHNKFR